MVLEAERWLELRRFRVLREAGASLSEIARETGLNWRTVKKYLEGGGPSAPPAAVPQAGSGRQVIAEYAPVIDAWLRAEVLLKGTVIHERLVAEYGFTGNYQRVKLYLQEARPSWGVRPVSWRGCTVGLRWCRARRPRWIGVMRAASWPMSGSRGFIHST